MSLVLVVLGLAAAGIVLRACVGARRRRAEARRVATELLPEIRGVLDSSDAGGEPVAARAFPEARERLPRLLGAEALFAVETFYQSVEAYREAAKDMREAFADGSEWSLGDRIRAKDRRDRCLKDVFYSGEAAIERLSRIAS